MRRISQWSNVTLLPSNLELIKLHHLAASQHNYDVLQSGSPLEGGGQGTVDQLTRHTPDLET